MTKSKIVFFLIVLSLVLLGIAWISNKNTLEKELDTKGAKVQYANELVIKEKFTALDRTLVIEAKGRRINVFVKIAENKTKEQAQKFIQESSTTIESLFATFKTPYPGAITQIIECPEKFKPIKLVVDNGIAYILLAGERFNFGICLDELIKYKAIFSMFYCENTERIYTIETFADVKDIDAFDTASELVKSFECV